MATVSSISPYTLPVAGADMDAEPITTQFNNILSFLNEASNFDEANCDLTTTTGLVGKSTAQTVTGTKSWENTQDAAGGVRDVAKFGIDPGSGTAADNDGGRLTFYADDDGGNATDVARMDWVLTDASNTTEDARIDWSVITAGTLASELQLSGASLNPTTDAGLTLGTASLRFGTVYADTIGDSTQALGVAATTLSFDAAATIDTSGNNNLTLSAGTASLVVTAGDVTVYDDNNGADVSLTMGTGSAESFSITVDNGGSNKTAEEIKLTSKTASGTTNHGKIGFYVDEVKIGTFDDGGLDLESGMVFSVNGSTVVSSVIDSIANGADNRIVTFSDSDSLNGEANLEFDGSTLSVNGSIDMVANTNRIDLDADNDTSIRASADDTIMFELAGADDFSMTANSLNILSGSVIDLADNAPVQFGDEDDASIKWDATNLAIAAGSADVKITASNVIPATNDGSALGVSGTAWSDLFLASGSVVDFHAGDVTLTHSANTLTVAGGTLATAALTAAGTVTVGVDDTGYDVKFFGAAAGAFSLWDEDQNRLEIRGATAAGAGTLRLSTGELTVVDGDKLGQIDFVAPVEESGTDAILVGASIYAEADDTFAADNNSTDLIFATGASAAAAERMRIDSDGAVTKPSNPAFLARNSSTDSNVTGNGTEVTIDFDTEVFDQGDDFASDTFTAPVTGRYQLNVSCEVSGVTSSHTIGQLQIKTSNRTIMADQNDTFQSAGSNGQCMYHGSFLADMDAGDTVTCTMAVHNGSQVVDILANNTHFSGFLAS